MKKQTVLEPPNDITKMTDEQLRAELDKAYAQIDAGETIPAEQAFADIRKKLNNTKF